MKTERLEREIGQILKESKKEAFESGETQKLLSAACSLYRTLVAIKLFNATLGTMLFIGGFYLIVNFII